MDLRYPSGGAELAAMRREGRVPELPVLVALGTRISFNNLTLSATPGQRYDWRPVRGLYVEVFASADVPWSDVLQTLADIAAMVPDQLVLQFLEGPRVHLGESRVVPGQDFALFDWFPMAICPIHAAASHTLTRRLWAAVGDQLPDLHGQAHDLVMQLVADQHNQPKGALCGTHHS